MSSEGTIATAVQKLLTDSRQEERKRGAQKVAEQCRRFYTELPPPESYRQIERVLASVENTLLSNAQASARRGGLLCISSVARALPHRVEHDTVFVGNVVAYLMPYFKDIDMTVRLAAVEAAVNVVSVFRAQVLRTSFTELFRGMLCTIADRELKVQTACNELSNVIKEITGELVMSSRASPLPQSQQALAAAAMSPINSSAPTAAFLATAESDAANAAASGDEGTPQTASAFPPAAATAATAATATVAAASSPAGGNGGVVEFPTERFVNFVQEGLQASTPESIIFALQWLEVADSVPGRRLVLQLGGFLGRLFGLISTNYPTVAQATETTLRRFSDEVRKAHRELNLVALAQTTLPFVLHPKARTREVAFEWLLLLLEVGQERLLAVAHNAVTTAVNGVSDPEPRVRELADALSTKCGELMLRLEHRGGGLAAAGEALRIAGPGAIVSSAVSPGERGAFSPTSDTMSPVRSFGAAGYAPGSGSLSASTSGPELGAPASSSVVDEVRYDALLEGVRSAVGQPEASRLLLLKWVALVHVLSPDTVRAQLDLLFPALLAMLRDHGAVLDTALEVLSEIAGEDRFSSFIEALIGKLATGPPEVLAKAPTIFKRLQLLYMGQPTSGPNRCPPAFATCEKLFLEAAHVLVQHDNKQFAARLATTLHYMLLTAEELGPLREVLKCGVADPRARAAFAGLYPCWCYNPAAAVALCLLTKSYDHAHRLVVLLGNGECSSHTLVQLDRLVQLLESPVFAFVRMAMLSPKENAALVRALFGMQMILPQSSQQFRVLHHRLKSVMAVSLLDDAAGGAAAASLCSSPPVAAAAATSNSSASNRQGATLASPEKQRECQENGNGAAAIAAPSWTTLESQYIAAQDALVAFERGMLPHP